MALRKYFSQNTTPGTFCRAILLFVIIFGVSDLAGQTENNKKEVISITSSFKPSIVKTGKLEFSASPLPKDLSSYNFIYPTLKTQFVTPMRSFMVRPLSYKSDDLDKDTSSIYAKLGYGNLNTPFASLGFKQNFTKSILSFTADHISSKGNIPDQMLQNSSVGVGFKHTIDDNQSIAILTGYDRDAFRLYGFDHSLYSYNTNDIKQEFNNVYFEADYRITTGEKNQVTFSPTFRADLLTASRNVQEQLVNFKMPIIYTITDDWKIQAEPTVTFAQLKSTQNTKFTNKLLTIPILAQYTHEHLQVNAGVIPVFQDGSLKAVPNFLISYALGRSGVKVKGGISNTFNINSYHALYGFNPFLLSPDTLTNAHNTDYFVGFDFVNAKGLQLRFKTGVIQYRNQPLFYNSLGDGKNLLSINDQSFTALNVEGAVDYNFSRKLSLTASVQALHFADFIGQMKAYGLIPLIFSGGISWMPVDELLIKGRVYLWQGAMARDIVMNDLRLKAAADISLGVEYKLNKKWALWADLNNIANSTYQRWNQYPGFGFHAMGGVRYAIHK